MLYEKYIKLGFERTDMQDVVEYNRSGYYGFALKKDVCKKMFIEVSGDDLTKPRLYIRKRGKDTYHILHISTEVVLDLLHKEIAMESPVILAC
jgi:hypothetical protein